ncbi:hypothetical protein [Deinococcus humi]|uniref:Uncharacterized protein n=1 Tax=Deinococcus humi TaxID=662880 RepID=A0A7W8NCU3_9DEIO|nr:hypothetical protein [Deinococcus humi]MBB5362579.1 hypothetical protein [Deinococcus humi]
MHFDLQFAQQHAQALRQEAAQASRALQAQPAHGQRPQLSLRNLFHRPRPA